LVVTIAAGLKLRVISAFVAVVVPWVNSSTSRHSTLAAAAPFMIASIGLGVLGTLATVCLPLESRTKMSVNVPPTSMASRTRDLSIEVFSLFQCLIWRSTPFAERLRSACRRKIWNFNQQPLRLTGTIPNFLMCGFPKRTTSAVSRWYKTQKALQVSLQSLFAHIYIHRTLAMKYSYVIQKKTSQ